MSLTLNGATSGSTTVQATDAVTATLTLPSSTGTLLSTANPQSGGVIQVVQAVKTDGFSTTSGSAVDITGMTATITPKFSTSKILVMVSLYTSTDSSPYPKVLLQRNGANICLGDALNSASRISIGASFVSAAQPLMISSQQTFLDSPATTSAVTYKLQIYTFSGRVIYVNRDAYNGVDANSVSVPSTITLMEIAA